MFTLSLITFIFSLPVTAQQQYGNVTTLGKVPESTPQAIQVTQFTRISPDIKLVPYELTTSISFEKTVCDLGDISQGTKNTCEFRFTNTGRGLLKIGKISRTCGCTAFQLDKKEYAPSETGTIKVIYTAGKSTATTQKSIYVPTNDKANPRVKLTVKANIVQLIEVIPQKLQLSLRKENAGIPDITLRSIDDSSFSIKVFISTNHNSIAADFDPNASAYVFILRQESLSPV